jgi:hypothetical protein
MILHLTKDTLEWQEIHHEEFATPRYDNVSLSSGSILL